MRHRKRTVKLGRTSSHRRAMFRNMVTSLLDRERIETTVAKAKEASSLAEKMVTLAKRGTLHARRQALAYVMDKQVVSKLFSALAERYADRNGGYTRIIRTGFRQGDGAELALVEMVGRIAPKPKAKKKKAKKAEASEKTKQAAAASADKKPSKSADAQEEGEMKSRAKPKKRKKDSE